jgi:CheY-specific phosphatase CheX
MQFAEQEITEITATIWQSLLGMDVEGLGEPPPSQQPANDVVMGCIQITGAWTGALVLQCPWSFAEKMAKIALSLGTETVSREETHDVIGELTNTAGGNIKALLPGPSTLSLPTVVGGDDYSMRVPGTTPITRLSFKCGDESFTLTLLESSDIQDLALEGAPSDNSSELSV